MPPDDARAVLATASMARPHVAPEPVARRHATVVAVDQHGVVLLGPVGSGKSDLAVRLIDAGAVLVGDDQIIVEQQATRLIARPADQLRGLIEVRGLGILRLPYVDRCAVDLLVELVSAAEIRADRLPERRRRVWLGTSLPVVRVDPRAPSAAAVVRLAVSAERVA